MSTLENDYKPGNIQVDRMTVHVSAVYQSDALRETTPITHAFDRIKENGDSPLLVTNRLSPSKSLEIRHSGDSEMFRWVLIHLPIISTDDTFKAAAKQNTVRVKDASGNLISVLPCNESVTVVHPGPLFAETDKTTCSLKTMVMPY
jgi:hypothetical protein